MPKVLSDGFEPFSREDLAAIADALYGLGDRWHSALARDLTRLRGTSTSVSGAAVHQWMHADNRRPPAWATPLVYRLLAERRAELVLRSARLEGWHKWIAENALGKGGPLAGPHKRRASRDVPGSTGDAAP